jgi:quercetin dioxygenase-like cupin family protein
MKNILSKIVALPSGDEHFEILSRQNAFRMRSGYVTLQPGKDVGTHSTEDFEEIIIIIEGHGELETEGSGRKAIGAGQIAYHPPDTRHNVINTDDKPLKYIYVVSKAR